MGRRYQACEVFSNIHFKNISTPSDTRSTDSGEWRDLIPGMPNDSTKFTNAEILHNLYKAAGIIQQNSGIDYWTTKGNPSC